MLLLSILHNSRRPAPVIRPGPPPPVFVIKLLEKEERITERRTVAVSSLSLSLSLSLCCLMLMRRLSDQNIEERREQLSDQQHREREREKKLSPLSWCVCVEGVGRG